MRHARSQSSLLAAVGLLLLGGAGGGAPDAEIQDGIDVFFRDAKLESTAAQELATFPQVEAGESKRLERSFPDAPPQIPHSVEDMLPITLGSNECLDCHDPSAGEGPGGISVPKTHLRHPLMGEGRKGEPMRWVVKGYEQREVLSGARYHCTMCHTPQSLNARTIGSRFERIRGEPTQ